MTLDEAIVHAREVSERNRKQWKNCPADRRDIEHKTCEQCAEEHEQLAEWLEELKAYREIGTVEGYKSAIECYPEEYIIRKSNKQYNKAIDDFVEACENQFIAMYGQRYIDMRNVKEIAEQLKEGGENDRAGSN